MNYFFRFLSGKRMNLDSWQPYIPFDTGWNPLWFVILYHLFSTIFIGLEFSGMWCRIFESIFEIGCLLCYSVLENGATFLCDSILPLLLKVSMINGSASVQSRCLGSASNRARQCTQGFGHRHHYQQWNENEYLSRWHSPFWSSPKWEVCFKVLGLFVTTTQREHAKSRAKFTPKKIPYYLWMMMIHLTQIHGILQNLFLGILQLTSYFMLLSHDRMCNIGNSKVNLHLF